MSSASRQAGRLFATLATFAGFAAFAARATRATLTTRAGFASFAALVALIVASGAAFAEATVDVTIEPREIALGESARLTIMTSGSALQSVSLPQVQGLQFRVVGQSRQIQMINGITLATTSTIVSVTPETAGVFTIPGMTPKAPPLVLHVKPGNGSGGVLPPNNFGTPGNTPITPNGSNSSGPNSNGLKFTADGSAFVRLVLPKRDVYVGESVPVEIQIGMRSGFVTSINGLPTLTGGDFTLNNLSHQPEREEKIIDGKPFVVLTWRSVLAAIKPGTFTLTAETPVTVRIRTRNPRDSMMDDLLGDPFMQNFFGTTVAKDITVASAPTPFTVLALPTQDRPPEFSGAVGTFKIASDISSKAAVAGDPLTLRMHVTGEGNFDRVDSAMLERAEPWKTYPPKSSFKPGDAIGYKGEKDFEQPLIASQPGTLTIPALAFTYFDPTTHRYETAKSAPLSVTISLPAGDTATGQPLARGAAAPGPSEAAHPGLRPDHAGADPAVASLVPLFFQAQFLAIPSVLSLGFFSGWLLIRRRARPTGEPRKPRLRAQSKATLEVLAQLEAASRGGNTTFFLNSARAALQRNLAARWRVPPEHITTDDIDARLGPEGSGVRQIFALADEANYSGFALTTADYARWIDIVKQQLTAEPAA